MVNYESNTVPELKAKAKAKGLSGYSKLNKKDLIKLLRSGKKSAGKKTTKTAAKKTTTKKAAPKKSTTPKKSATKKTAAKKTALKRGQQYVIRVTGKSASGDNQYPSNYFSANGPFTYAGIVDRIHIFVPNDVAEQYEGLDLQVLMDEGNEKIFAVTKMVGVDYYKGRYILQDPDGRPISITKA